MALITAAATASTLAQLITHIREFCGDVATTSGNQRFSDAQIRRALDFSIADMWNRITSGHAGPYLQSNTFTYTGALEYAPLPSGLDGNRIYMVEDVTRSDQVFYIQYSGIHAAEFPEFTGWFLEGRNIALRPVPTADRSLRIWTAQNFPRIYSGADADTHSLPVNFEELMVLGAAKRLLLVDKEWSIEVEAHFQDQMKLFVGASKRQAGPTYVRNNRRLK